MNTDYIQSLKDQHRQLSTKSLITEYLKLYHQDKPSKKFKEIEDLLFLSECQNIVIDKHRGQLLDDTVDVSINELSDKQLLRFFEIYTDPRYLLKLHPERITGNFRDELIALKKANHHYMIDVAVSVHQRLDILNMDLRNYHGNSNKHKRQALYVQHGRNYLKDFRKLFNNQLTDN